MKMDLNDMPKKARTKNAGTGNALLILLAVAGLGLGAGNQPASPQSFTNLHNFTLPSASSPFTNSDGFNPDSGLIISSNVLFGTAYHGGSNGNGAIFRLNIDGTHFTNLHSFTALNATTHTNIDGANPEATLVLLSNILYGTASTGGSNGNGSIFSITTDGSVFKVLHSFTATVTNTNSDGALPLGGLILSSNLLYGTAAQGGAAGEGTVFRMSTNGSGFTNLHSFKALSTNPPYTNSEGAQPVAGLILSTNLLYGTAYFGGASGKGAIFQLNTNGSGFTNLYSFTATSGAVATNSDGANLNAGLVLSSNYLFGEAYTGGSLGFGTVFKVKTDGTGITTLHNFDYADGEYPNGGLVLSGNTLYGAAAEGGAWGNGTVFAVNTDGSDFTNVHDFSATTLVFPYATNSDGANLASGLVLSNSMLYGTAFAGGNSGAGTVFQIFLAPQLDISLSGNKVILTWPINATGFTLQATRNFAPPQTWTNVSPAPVIINNQYTVTNSISGAGAFYRLSQ
jgi:uncharacterized repeat protein (TIGR03803 family)